MSILEKKLSNLQCFILIILTFNVSCSYYENGTKSVMNPIESLIWANDDYITYKTNEEMYVTESLEESDEKYEIYRSHLQPKSQNAEFFYTAQSAVYQEMRVTFFNRGNLPLCWLDSNDIQSVNIQKILINSASVYMLENKSKIRINTLQDPEINNSDDQEIPDCLYQRYNWTNKDNEKYSNKEFLSLHHRDQLAITYSDHIQVLLKNSQQQFAILQTIDLLVNMDLITQNNKAKLSQKGYEVMYYVNEKTPLSLLQQDSQQQMIVIVMTQQLWVYHRSKDSQKFIFSNKIRLNQTILSLQIISLKEAYILIKEDCSLYEVSLVDQKIQPVKIDSYITLCSSSLLDFQLGVRQNGDVIVVGVEQQANTNMQLTSLQQLTINIIPIHTPTPTSIQVKQDRTYHITLSHRQTQFHLLAYHFLTQTDYLFLLLQQPDTKAELFIGFDVRKLLTKDAGQQQMLDMQWQWMSERFENGVLDYSIDQTGIIVLEYDPLTKIQDLTWYETTILVDSSHNSQQPSTLSRINTVAFYQNTEQLTTIAYDFILDKEQYIINSSNHFIISSPGGNITLQIDSNHLKQINVYEKQLFMGTISLEHEIDPINPLLQFMNDTIIAQLSKVSQQAQATKLILNGYVITIDATKNSKFTYTTLQQTEIPQTSDDEIKINQDNIIYLDQNQKKIIILQVGQSQFQIEQQLQLSPSIQNVKQLKLELSENGNIYAVEQGQQKVYQWVYCKEYEYFEKGKCLHKPIGPDPNPFPIITIILAIIGGLAIIVVATYQILRYKAIRRRAQLQRSLIEQEGEMNQQIIRQRIQDLDIDN